jgi:hypothetical protein
MRGSRGRVMDWCAVDEGSAPPRIEIELTEHEGKRSRRDRRRGQQTVAPAATASAVPWGASDPPEGGVFSPAVEPGRSGTGFDGPLRSERNRLLVTGLAVGAVALFIGWALGRSGGDGDGSAQTVDGATTTTVDDESATDDSAATGDTLPAAELPATTRPRPSTTTTLPPEWVFSAVEVDPRLAGASDRIVAIGADGELIDVDVATGEVRTLMPGRPQVSAIASLIAGDDWALVTYDDGSPPRVFHSDDGIPTAFEPSDAWSTYWEVDSDRFWTVDYSEQFGQAETLVEIDVDGGRTGRAIDLNGLWPTQSDPAGGVVVSGSVGTFSVTPDGSRRFGDGALVAISAGHALMYACGDTIESCGLEILDRDSGAAQPVPPLPAPYDDMNKVSNWWGAAPSRPTITPDGAAALITVVTTLGNPEPAVVDLATGEVTTFANRSGGIGGTTFSYPSATWSGDGRFAYVVDRSTLTAFDRATGEVFPVGVGGFPEVRTLTIRPTAGGDPAPPISP